TPPPPTGRRSVYLFGNHVASHGTTRGAPPARSYFLRRVAQSDDHGSAQPRGMVGRGAGRTPCRNRARKAGKEIDMIEAVARALLAISGSLELSILLKATIVLAGALMEIGRASCRERV